MGNRQGWPIWAVERAECASCGTLGYSDIAAPHHASIKFQDWVREIWPGGLAQQTRLGFFIWCSGQCRHVWTLKREKSMVDSGSKEWAREMDRRRIRSGVQ